MLSSPTPKELIGREGLGLLLLVAFLSEAREPFRVFCDCFIREFNVSIIFTIPVLSHPFPLQLSPLPSNSLPTSIPILVRVVCRRGLFSRAQGNHSPLPQGPLSAYGDSEWGVASQAYLHLFSLPPQLQIDRSYLVQETTDTMSSGVQSPSHVQCFKALLSSALVMVLSRLSCSSEESGRAPGSYDTEEWIYTGTVSPDRDRPCW